MKYQFIDTNGTFIINKPHPHVTYFPLTNKNGTILSSISPNLSGDIKGDNNSFITPPATAEDLRGNLLCRRDFFITTGDQLIRLSETPTQNLECGFLYHKLTKTTGPFVIQIGHFIPHELNVEVMWVQIYNRSKKKITLRPTSFMPLYGRTAENIRDHRHVSSLLNRIELLPHGILLKPTMTFDEKGHSLNTTTYFCLGYEENGTAPLGQFPTLDYFCGDSDLLHPGAIEKNIKPVQKKIAAYDGKEVIGAFRFKDKVLRPNEFTYYCVITGFETEAGKAHSFVRTTLKALNSPAKVARNLHETSRYWQDYLSAIQYDFKNPGLNNWLLWVKLQPTLRKLFGCSFLPHFDYGKGGRGWRDLWQDALSLLLTEPKEAKKLIVHSIKGVRLDGSNATIIARDGTFISDRNKINRVWMDHGVWPYLTLRAYINQTGDLAFLKQDVSYFQDHLFCRGKVVDQTTTAKDLLLRTKDKTVYKGSILEHILLELLVQFFNVGKHNIIRLENADWNDGLDMAADKGESVAFSFMYAHHLKDICFFLQRLKTQQKAVLLLKETGLLLDRLSKPIDYNNYRAKQKRLALYFTSIKNISGRKTNVLLEDIIKDLTAKANHLSAWLRKKEWLAYGFFNGYYDNTGCRVEGKRGNHIRMMLTSQVFAIMSGIATDDQIKKIWSATKKHLKDKSQGGFRLNTDFGPPRLDLGRAFGFSYGDKENGAFFSHMNVMFAYALYSRGFIKEGYEVFASLYQMATNPKARIYPGLPEYFNNEGQGLYAYLTGSASWYMRTLFEQVLGIVMVMGDIVLEPKLVPQQFRKNTIELAFGFASKKIKLTYICQSHRKLSQAGKTGSLPTAKKPLTVKKATLEEKPLPLVDGKIVLNHQALRRFRKKNLRLKAYLS